MNHKGTKAQRKWEEEKLLMALPYFSYYFSSPFPNPSSPLPIPHYHTHE